MPKDTTSGNDADCLTQEATRRNVFSVREPLFLELGGDVLFGLARPDNTVVLWANLHDFLHGRTRKRSWGWSGLATALRRSRSPDTDLIVLHAKVHAPWDPRYIGRCLAKLGPLALPYLVKDGLIYLIVALARAPVVVIDRADHSSITRLCLWTMKRSVRYFKRELPPDRWQTLAYIRHRTSAPTRRIRRRKSLRRALDRMRPISLGFPQKLIAPPQCKATDKTIDVFFAGAVEASSTVRERGLLELEALRAAGIRVTIVPDRLSQESFYDHCRRSWLVWSPEGHGWDCFRHYEVPMNGSVPLINQPRIERYAPLLDGVHCVYYDVEPGGLTRAVESALADRRKLLEMAKVAQAHVATHHAIGALCEYVIHEAGVAKIGDADGSSAASTSN